MKMMMMMVMICRLDVSWAIQDPYNFFAFGFCWNRTNVRRSLISLTKQKQLGSVQLYMSMLIYFIDSYIWSAVWLWFRYEPRRSIFEGLYAASCGVVRKGIHNWTAYLFFAECWTWKMRRTSVFRKYTLVILGLNFGILVSLRAITVRWLGCFR